MCTGKGENGGYVCSWSPHSPEEEEVGQNKPGPMSWSVLVSWSVCVPPDFRCGKSQCDGARRWACGRDSGHECGALVMGLVSFQKEARELTTSLLSCVRIQEGALCYLADGSARTHPCWHPISGSSCGQTGICLVYKPPVGGTLKEQPGRTKTGEVESSPAS